MFTLLGQAVSRFWIWIILGWIGLLIALRAIAPPMDDVLKQGEFAFLPEDSPSRVAEEIFQESFPDDILASSVVLVVRRPSLDAELDQDDKEYIRDVLVPALAAFGFYSHEEGEPPPELEPWQRELRDHYAKIPLNVEGMGKDETLLLTQEQSEIIYRIRDFTHPRIGHLLDSEDGRASLILIDLETEFADDINIRLIYKLEKIREMLKLQEDDRLRIPAGLELSLSGSATVGRDMRVAMWESGRNTERATLALVLILLILIYRAPFLAIIPLMTVGLAVSVSMQFLMVLADHGILELFKDIETYVTVLVYGAGVDYCLFLIARYKEELDRGATYDEAIGGSISKVGAALAASAATTSIGIGMMAFAEFGKFQQAGIAICISILICLTAALTFASALLRLSGKWAFWPYVKSERVGEIGWLAPTSLIGKLIESGLIDRLWIGMTERIRRTPGRIWLAAIAMMIPFAIHGANNFSNLSYGLLSELPSHYLSVQGAKAVSEHFPEGTSGPVIVVLKNESVRFSENSTVDLIGKLSDRIEERSDELGVADIRSVATPTGISALARAKEEDDRKKLESLSTAQRLVEYRIRQQKIREYYFSKSEKHKDSVTKLEIVFQNDPFSRDSIADFVSFQSKLRTLIDEFDANLKAEREELLKELEEEGETPDEPLPPIRSTEIFVLGPTASITDLKNVTDRDQIRIDILVLLAVYAILVLLLRKPKICLYLLGTVFFTYFVSLGMTFIVFSQLDPVGFAGLDWKVPIFLFTILIAVGEDYNILLMTRIEEEQQEHGLVNGTLVALRKTGSIISSCGIIMAGTFSSLLFGTIVGMQQLGFALAFGVLLDTFVVRPILVPAWLVMLYRRQFGRFSALLGAPPLAEPPEPDPEENSAEYTPSI
jgi:putative drug exporter of the RND superfamily